MFGIGIQELGLIFVVALLVFGPKRLPELARTLGRGLGEFRRASNELRQSLALDELQDDLRRDLGAAGTILKPAPPPDRPAQAGDDLDPAKTRKPIPQTPPGAQAVGPASDETESSPEPAPERPSGELPLGNDHEHHDEDPSADPSEPRNRTRG